MDAAGGGDFTTIQAAVNSLPNPGPCAVIVKAGTYRETVTIESANSLATSEAQRIVIQSETPGAAIVDPSALAGTRVGSCATGALNAHGFTICSRGSAAGDISGFLTIKGFTIEGATVDGVNIFSSSSTSIAGHDLTIDGNDIHTNGTLTGSGNGNGITIGINNPRLWIVNNLMRNNTRHGVAWTSASPTGTTYLVNNTIVSNRWSGVTRPGSTSVVLVNNLIAGNGFANSGSGNCKCGLGQESAGTATSITLKNNMFYGNGSGNSPGSGLRNINDFGSPSDVLDPTDSGNFTTIGHANNASSTTTGIAGCTFGDCSELHLLTEIVGTDFHLKTDPPPSPAIDAALASFVAELKEWVPAFDFDGDVRPRGPAKDIGFDEAPPIPPTPTPTQTPTPTPTRPPGATCPIIVDRRGAATSPRSRRP